MLRPQPRQDGNQNGNITQYAVYVSSNGTTWGSPVATGTWANDTTQKYAVFTPVSARYVRIMALATIGSPATSAAEVNVMGVAPTAGAGGRWSAPIGFPLVPVSAVMLPNDKLLTFSAVDDMEWTTAPDTITNVAVLDLKTGQVSEPAQVNTHHQMFCDRARPAGERRSADQRRQQRPGDDDLRPVHEQVERRAADEHPPRVRGRYHAVDRAGVDARGLVVRRGRRQERRDLHRDRPPTGSWRELSGVVASKILTDDPAGVFRADNHVWLFAQANGTVFQAGPSKQMNWITTTGNGSMKSAGLRGTADDEMNGNAVMYGVGKILALGGATAYQDTAR